MLSREHMYAHDRASGLTESALLEASDHSGEQRRLQQKRVRGGGSDGRSDNDKHDDDDDEDSDNY